MPNSGRQPGGNNKFARDLKQAILDAAAIHGADGHGSAGLTGYLTHLAANYPGSFAGLLGKMLPLQVSADINSRWIQRFAARAAH